MTRSRPGLNGIPSSAVLALAALLMLGGCLGDGGPSRPAGNPTQPERDEGRVVSGTVVDEEFQPVSDAEVRHVGGNATARSDANGSFRLTRLPAAPGVSLTAAHAAHRSVTLRVDLQFTPTAEIRFVLPRAPSIEPYHYTNTTHGEITCQVAFGSHHGFPGFYRYSCAEYVPGSTERVRVTTDPGLVAGVLELVWRPQSQFADIMGLTVYLTTNREDRLLAALHSLPGAHYLAFFTGSGPVEVAREGGGVFDSFVHVDPSLVDEHVPTNVGVVIEQTFSLYTTAFYGEPPPPTWSYVRR